MDFEAIRYFKFATMFSILAREHNIGRGSPSVSQLKGSKHCEGRQTWVM
jgi:hypothetical protein